MQSMPSHEPRSTTYTLVLRWENSFSFKNTKNWFLSIVKIHFSFYSINHFWAMATENDVGSLTTELGVSEETLAAGADNIVF